MIFRKWEELPDFLRIDEVYPYWEILNKKRGQLMLKRVLDLLIAISLLPVLLLPMILIGFWIKMDSKGSVFFRQERMTAYGKKFQIHKFRTMVNNAENSGAAVTRDGDNRITSAGKMLRKYRLDELPQILDVLSGDMSFVGTRPESIYYIDRYQPEFYATLLLPAGITSEASIKFKDEGMILKGAADIDRLYLEKVLPEKMKWNLNAIRDFSVWKDIITMFRTVLEVIR